MTSTEARATLRAAAMGTWAELDEAIDAFAASVKAKERADVVAWLRASSARMDEQSKIPGIVSIGPLYDCGQLAAAESLAKGIAEGAHVGAAEKASGQMITMRERLRKFFDLEEVGEPASGFGEEDLVLFASSEVRLALAPREVSPELAEAEKWLRRVPVLPDGRPWDYAEKQAPVIASELDRLRAIERRLTGEARRTVYVHDNNAESALTDVINGNFYGTEDRALEELQVFEHVYAVTLTAKEAK